jgi:heptosyltransferase-2
MSLPALRAIRGRFPEAHIAVQAMPWVAELYVRETFANEVIRYTARRDWRDWSGRRYAARELRERGFDCAILLTNSFDSALVAWMAGIPRRIGYARDARGLLLTDPVTPPKRGEISRHERSYYLELLQRVGLVAGAGPMDKSGDLSYSQEARAAGERRFEAAGVTGAVIGVSPGAAYGSAKRWLPERFAEAAARVAGETGATVVLFGSPDERPVCEVVAQRVAELGGTAQNFAGQTKLSEFIEMAAACRLFLTNDSGAMHVASALGVPTVAVFGATDHEATGPVGVRAVVVREPVDCSPCLLRECPIDHRCMKAVSVEQVASVAIGLFQ